MASFYPYAKFVVGIRGGCNFGYFNSLSEAMACGGPRTAGFESAKILGRFPTHMQPFGQTSAANSGALAHPELISGVIAGSSTQDTNSRNQ